MPEDVLPQDKALTEMTDEEILSEINRLRDRRAAARERRAADRSSSGEPSTPRKKRGDALEVSGTLGSALDDIFADDNTETLCGKCGTAMQDGVCPNLTCE